MSTIIVKVKDLIDRVQELSEDKMDFVEISFHESADDDPDFLFFSAWKKNSSYEAIDYDVIEAVEQ